MLNSCLSGEPPETLAWRRRCLRFLWEGYSRAGIEYFLPRSKMRLGESRLQGPQRQGLRKTTSERDLQAALETSLVGGGGE